MKVLNWKVTRFASLAAVWEREGETWGEKKPVKKKLLYGWY